MYERVHFPVLSTRPYFYTNFVSTLDGKVEVPTRHNDYWPIGSPIDHVELMNLRIHADALVHGRGLAAQYGAVTLRRLATPEFADMRAATGKLRPLLYIVLSDHPDEALRRQLAGANATEAVIASGKDIPGLAWELKQQGVNSVLVEGGPHVAASFFAVGLMDEIFLTVAPKVFGGAAGEALTMIEGPLLPPERTSGWKLISAEPVGDEIFLRYRSGIAPHAD